MDKVIPGRMCGDCTVCCIVPSIDSPEIQKKSATRCRYLAGVGGSGCTIYEARPRACRGYDCGWRLSDVIPESWRPGDCGVLADVGILHVPPRYVRAFAVTLILVADPEATAREPWFVDFVSARIAADAPVFLSLPGPPGHLPAKLLLNNINASPTVQDRLTHALKVLTAHTYQPQVMAHQGRDAGA